MLRAPGGDKAAGAAYILGMRDEASMIDPFGRGISYLRVSVTDRCDFRCVYCMAEDMTFLPKAEILSLEELDRLCTAFVRLGVRKLRLTGGEPLVRKNVMSLVRALSRHLPSGASMSPSIVSSQPSSLPSPAGAGWRRCSTASPPPRPPGSR